MTLESIEKLIYNSFIVADSNTIKSKEGDKEEYCTKK